MSSDVPDWIRLACGRWGRQKRRVWQGHEWYVNPLGGRQQHVDGYAQSLLGRIREEREGASQGMPTQHWPEVFWGDGLDVQRSLIGMPEKPYAAIHLHYVWDPEWNVRATEKASALGMTKDVYYDSLDRAEYWIWSRLEVKQERRDTQIVEEIGKLIRETLRDVETSAINSQASERCPRDLNFAALNRPKISLKAR